MIIIHSSRTDVEFSCVKNMMSDVCDLPVSARKEIKLAMRGDKALPSSQRKKSKLTDVFFFPFLVPTRGRRTPLLNSYGTKKTGTDQ